MRYNTKMWYCERKLKPAVVLANFFMGANCELNCRCKTATTATFFHKLCPFPWTKRQPNMVERTGALVSSLGSSIYFARWPSQIIQPVGHSFLKCKVVIDNSRSKETVWKYSPNYKVIFTYFLFMVGGICGMPASLRALFSRNRPCS